MRAFRATARMNKPIRWTHFSLKALLGLVLIACILLGWTSIIAQNARERRIAVNQIEELGGYVRHAHQWNPSRDAYEPAMRNPPGPWLVRKILGDDAFFQVTEVSIYETINLKDDDLTVLRHLPNIEEISLTLVPVTGAGIKHLTELDRLRVLNLSMTYVDDDAIPFLRQISSLRHLDLSSTSITDAGVRQLEEFSHLEHLDVSNNRLVSSEAAHQLQRSLPNTTVVY